MAGDVDILLLQESMMCLVMLTFPHCWSPYLAGNVDVALLQDYMAWLVILMLPCFRVHDLKVILKSSCS